MNESSSVELKRDCEAVRIPSGDAVILPAGTTLDITQTLGGTFTVRTLDGLYRVTAANADALGREASDAGSPGEKFGGAANEGSPEERIWAALKTCYDPEIPVNIVDLGLVYDMHLESGAAGGNKVFVKMTLTAPGCGMGPAIAGDAQQKLLDLPGVEDASVEIVWDPPWHQSMITTDGRKILGLE
jgi:probable FeS assembly SUF system protein SufT